MSGGTVLDKIEIKLRNRSTDHYLTVFIDVIDSSLSRKWLTALNNLLNSNFHLEKNYCFFGFPDGERDGNLLINEINKVIEYINNSNIDYIINDHFTLDNSINLEGEIGDLPEQKGAKINHEHFNMLHRYFEDLQGTAQHLSRHFLNANAEERWYIRQTNLLCHEFESWALSRRKKMYQPEWMRPSQLMCWINAPRFELDDNDFELFGIETIARPMGGVFVGVNKAVGKHHWEVWQDEGKHGKMLDSLTTTTMRGQTLAAGDFDIEWARDPGEYDFMKKELANFKQWLIDNNVDPKDKSLTIGHPQVGQVDLERSFGSTNYQDIWNTLYKYLDVYSIRTSDAYAEYDYHWSDPDFVERQIQAIGKH
jgi:hypothetical protein